MHIEVVCSVCEAKFQRWKGEVSRSLRLGRPMYCSRECAARANIKNIPRSSISAAHLNPGNKRDDHTPFRRHMLSIQKRDWECTVTLQDLKEQWERQDGVCPYTGWKLVNLNSTGHRLPKTPNRASLDRINSTRGYVLGNIQFVSLMAQYAKHGWGEEELIQFCEAVHEVRHVQNNE